MSVLTKRHAEPPVWLGTIFDRIVCGVDGTESSRVAVVQAKRLLAARRMLELVSVVEETSAAWSGLSAPSDIERSAKRLGAPSVKGRDQCPRARSVLLFGDPGPKLVSAAREVDATLAVDRRSFQRQTGCVRTRWRREPRASQRAVLRTHCTARRRRGRFSTLDCRRPRRFSGSNRGRRRGKGDRAALRRCASDSRRHRRRPCRLRLAATRRGARLVLDTAHRRARSRFRRRPTCSSSAAWPSGPPRSRQRQ